MRQYLISGLSPSDKGGVGILLKNLFPLALKEGYRIVARRDNQSIEELIASRRYFSAIGEYVMRIVNRWSFSLKTSFVRNAKILLIHPQSVGYRKVVRLARHNQVFIYVMDNSFFCIRSYNYDPIEKKECFRCLKSFDLIVDPCLIDGSSPKTIEFQSQLMQLKLLSGKITFLAQNELQRSLIHAFYGISVNCEVVGLDTGELSVVQTSGHERAAADGFDIVYHGSLSFAKGIEYTILLAGSLNEMQFLIPLHRHKVERLLGFRVEATNIVFEECNWNFGLKEHVINARYVLNPSLWSAPIEGAFIKSIACNGNVITVESEFGFEKEVARDFPLIRLPYDDVNEAACIIRKAVADGVTVGKKDVDAFVETFQQRNRIGNVLTAIR